MANLSPREGRPVSRREREKRAFQLIVAGGTASVLAVAGFVLALLDVIGGGLPLLAAIVAVLCFVLFRRTVS